MKRPNASPSPLICSSIMDLFNLQPVNNTSSRADNGAKIGPAKPVSIKSKNFGDNKETNPNAVMAAPVNQAAFFLVRLNFSAT